MAGARADRQWIMISVSPMSDNPDAVFDNKPRKRLEIALGGGERAFAAYELEDGAIRFHHTVVPESHGGRGIGTRLIKAAIAHAREADRKIIPICPFFQAYFRKHREEADIVAADYRHLVED